MRNFKITTLTFILVLFTLLVKAQTTEVAIGGDVSQPFKLNAANFAGMKQLTVKVTANDGREHTYSGVSSV
jgi:hypothetical protein